MPFPGGVGHRRQLLEVSRFAVQEGAPTWAVVSGVSQVTFCSEPIWTDFRQTYISGQIGGRHTGGNFLPPSARRPGDALWCEELNTSARWTKDLMRGIAGWATETSLGFNIRGDVMDAEASPTSSRRRGHDGERRDRELPRTGCVWNPQNGEPPRADLATRRAPSSRGIKIGGYPQFFNAWEEDDTLQTEKLSRKAQEVSRAFR